MAIHADPGRARERRPSRGPIDRSPDPKGSGTAAGAPDVVADVVIHDRDTIYSEGVDRTLEAIGLTVLKTPVRAPQANAFCERVIGTIRGECLDS
jgi:hypothetical protein